MKDYIQKRVLDLSAFIAERRATVRQAAKFFGVSKSTVHKDVTERLPKINRGLAREVKQILDTNKAERHLRGGEATRKKYQTRIDRMGQKGGFSNKT
ncbi:MAG TPA: sporulation transcriptional regulator SpoIIID [Firmicutes bacterium]|nr:sporulation transcriptional regulator SpoIIID [Bacillota bacterium]HOQ23349.1 sporulation transcriptional regulator SpoIIID [Bacillota bacterium]HPT66769.1 sporulation transcriptional regulator SpoIIID [Bacillota bacterium]